MRDLKIKEVQVVQNINGTEKIPVSNGSGQPAAITVNQILDKIPAPDLSNCVTKSEVYTKEETNRLVTESYIVNTYSVTGGTSTLLCGGPSQQPGYVYKMLINGNETTFSNSYTFDADGTYEVTLYFDMTKVGKSFSAIFMGCQNLIKSDISHFDTKNLVNIDALYLQCSNLTEIIGIEDLDVSNFTTLNSTFQSTAITHLNLSKWNTSNITTISYLFNITTLKYINISNWNLAKCSPGSDNTIFGFTNGCTIIADNLVTKNIGFLFGSCSGDIHLSLRNANLGEVPLNTLLQTGTFSSLDITNLKSTSTTSLWQIFKYVKKLIGFETANFGDIIKTDQIFMTNNLIKSIELDFSNHNILSGTFGSLFYGCTNLEYINIKNIKTANEQTALNSFFDGITSGCTNLKNLCIENVDFSNTNNCKSSYMINSYNLDEVHLKNFKFGNKNTLNYILSEPHCSRLILENWTLGNECKLCTHSEGSSGYLNSITFKNVSFGNQCNLNGLVNNSGVKEIIFDNVTFGENCDFTSIFISLKNPGTFYYNSSYGDYTEIINQLPENWNAVDMNLNNYLTTIPEATTDTLGGVKKITVDTLAEDADITTVVAAYNNLINKLTEAGLITSQLEV